MFKSLMTTAFVSCLCYVPCYAQSKAAQFEVQHQTRETQRRTIIANNLKLSEAEEDGFWVRYDSYRASVKEAEKIRSGLLEELSKTLVDMSEQEADSMVERALQLEVDNQILKQKHILGLSSVLDGANIFKYYQIETKLDASFTQGWTKNIPLVLSGEDQLVAIK